MIPAGTKLTVLFSAVLLLAAAFPATGRTDRRSTTYGTKNSFSGPATYGVSTERTVGERRGPFVENDTTFLYRHPASPEAGFCCAYVDHERRSARLFNRITPDSMEAEAREALAQEIALLHEKYGDTLPRHDLQACPRVWIPVKRLQGNLYIDMLDFYPFFLTERLCVRWYMDGPAPARIISFEEVSPACYRFRCDMSDGTGFAMELRITDPIRKIATVIERCGNAEYRYRCVAREEADRIPVIEWESRDKPCGNEIVWDDTPEKEDNEEIQNNN